jgi:hypothetical protein
VLRLPLRFLQGYVWRLGFLDGMAGLQVCFLVAYLSYLKQAYLWQLQQTRDWQTLENVDSAPHSLRVVPAEATVRQDEHPRARVATTLRNVS